jgi:FKBP-type peptidyl-prolyl cis-trans isomerase 2
MQLCRAASTACGVGRYTNEREEGVHDATAEGQQGRLFTFQPEADVHFRLNQGDVVRGLDLSVRGMCVGEQRVVVVPWQLGYGTARFGAIPAYSQASGKWRRSHSRQRRLPGPP